jgi:RND family efflux transporter MFP subunit
MKTIKLSITGVAVLVLIFSCTGNKQAQLSKLKEQQTTISDKIKILEGDLSKEKKDTLNPEKFKFVGLKAVSSNTFDHFIRVEGKLDGDQNAAVFAEAPGTVSSKFADKQKRLWDQKIGSEVQYLQSKTNKESFEKQISSLKQQVDKFKIKSPIDGTIEECNIKVGGFVSPDPRLAAYRVLAFRNLKVSAEVSEAYSAKVELGDKLMVLFPDINKQIETKVDFVSKYINPVNRTFIIETKLPDGINDLKANMIAIIQINDYHTDSAIQVPMNVIQTDQAGSYVYVVRSKEKYNAAFKQAVLLGNSYNGVAEVLKGLEVGDKVISAGYQELVDGEYVRF